MIAAGGAALKSAVLGFPSTSAAAQSGAASQRKFNHSTITALAAASVVVLEEPVVWASG